MSSSNCSSALCCPMLPSAALPGWKFAVLNFLASLGRRTTQQSAAEVLNLVDIFWNLTWSWNDLRWRHHLTENPTNVGWGQSKRHIIRCPQLSLPPQMVNISSGRTSKLHNPSSCTKKHASSVLNATSCTILYNFHQFSSYLHLKCHFAAYDHDLPWWSSNRRIQHDFSFCIQPLPWASDLAQKWWSSPRPSLEGFHSLDTLPAHLQWLTLETPQHMEKNEMKWAHFTPSESDPIWLQSIADRWIAGWSMLSQADIWVNCWPNGMESRTLAVQEWRNLKQCPSTAHGIMLCNAAKGCKGCNRALKPCFDAASVTATIARIPRMFGLRHHAEWKGHC